MIFNFFVVLVALLLFAGLSLDVAAVELRQRRAQAAADAAALGASYEMARGHSAWVSAGKADAALNGFTDGANNVTVTIINPPNSGSFSGDSSAIQALVTQSAATSFMALVHFPVATVQARAVATAAASPNCLYTLNASMSRSFMIGGGGVINANCGTFVDSNSSTALHLDGGASFTGTVLQVVGSYDNSGTLSPTPTTGVASETDPLASLTAPTFSSCNYTNWKMDSSTGSRTLSPGTYCGGMTISASGYTATFQPGLYIITGGINWNSSSTVVGSGVTLYFTTGGGYGYGQVVISGGVHLDLTAPLDSTHGGIPGILMWGDRNWNSTAQNVNFNGGSVTKLEGFLYFPTTGMIVSSGSLTSNGNYLDIITNNFTVNGGAGVTLPTPNFSQVSGGDPIKSGVTLAE